MVSLSEVAAGLQPTTKTYLTDSYKKTLLTTLLRFVPETKRSGYLITAETIMHPKGGAQPSDTGYIEGDGFKARVKKVLEQDVVVIHFAELLESSAAEGRTVRMTLDWEQRYLVMRLHTAGHIIDYAVLQLLGQGLLSSKAYHGPPEGYLEYIGDSGGLDPSLVERVANGVSQSSRRVYPVVVPREELKGFIKGAPNITRLPDIDYYRVIVIEGINAIPCGRTHVSNTGEVGKIRVVRIEGVENGFKVVYSVE
jgi:alanyl-tRNA synthetase